MKHLTLSIENVKEDCIRLASKIEADSFKPDCVIYIKTGGYLVGRYIADYFHIPVNGFRIAREGRNVKLKLNFIIRMLPKFVKNILRELEIKCGIHKKKGKRVVTEVDDNLIRGKNILLVDDSIDTGNTIIAAKKFLKDSYGEDFNIRVTGLNMFKESEKLIRTDYFLYEDSIIVYPWSNDSNEYEKFIKYYEQRNVQ